MDFLIGKTKSEWRQRARIFGVVTLLLLANFLPASPLYGKLGELTGIGWLVPGQAAAPPGQPTPTPQLLTGCDDTVTPDVTVIGVDDENKGSTIAETAVYRKQGNTAWTVFTTGTAITNLEPLTNYEFALGVNTTDFTDNMHGPYFTYQVKCQEADTIEKDVNNDENAAGLTTTFYNADENAAAQTFSAGDINTVFVKLKAGNNEVFGNPYIAASGVPDNGKHRAKYPNVLQIQLNKSNWEAPNKVYIARHWNAADVGVELRRIGCPTLATTTSVANDYCYELPVVKDIETRIAIELEADASNAPTIDQTWYMYPASWYIDSDTSTLEWGVENEDGNAVGTATAESVTADFT